MSGPEEIRSRASDFPRASGHSHAGAGDLSWDPTWEQVFRASPWGRYPPEELVRFMARNFFSVPERGSVRVLELGCGPGANLWFLSREGFDTHGIDGSATAIARAEGRLTAEGVTARLEVGDILSLESVYRGLCFDAIVDIGCLQHNRMVYVEEILDQVSLLLVPNGRVFAMMIARGSYGDGTGTEVEPGTFTGVTEGPAQGMGLCHFFGLEEVETVFSRFGDARIECSARSVNGRRQWVKHWVVDAVNRRPAPESLAVPTSR